jgi:general secretion pathway protein C
MDGDKVRGFRVYPGRNRLAFARLGLRPGDQVVAINGTPLDDQDRGQAILNTLGTSPDARVTVIRNGQQQDLTLNIAQVAQEAETATGPPTQPNVAPGAAGLAPESAPPPPATAGAVGTSPTNLPPPEPAAPEGPQPH